MPYQNQNINKAIVYALLTSLVGSLAAATTKYLTEHLNVGLIVFIQYGICLLTLTPWLLKHGVNGVKTTRLKTHIVRGAAGWCCFYTYYLAISEIPLVDATLLRNTAPICVPFFMLLLFNERLHRLKVAGVAIGFIGVLLVLKPQGSEISLWHGIGFLSGITLAVSMIYTRELTSSEPSNRILFYYFFISLVCSIPLAIADYTAIPLNTLPALGFVGLSIFITMKLYNLAYANGPANTLAPFSYFGVIFAGILGWLFWAHAPDAKSLFGMIAIIGGGTITLLLRNKSTQA